MNSENSGRKAMLKQSSACVAVARLGVLVPLMALLLAGGAQAADEKYPNWKGQWTRVVHREVEVQGAFDQTKPWGLGQQAPLTAEYQKVLKESMDDQANGGLGNYPTSHCLPS